MDNSLIAYFERLELMAFFSGYPLIFTLVYFISDKFRKSSPVLAGRLPALLPFSYALTASLFLGLVLKDMFPDYSLKNITDQFFSSYLRIWAVLALIFWIPQISKRIIFSLLHSLVFFFFLVRDLLMSATGSADDEIVKNDMTIYTDSMLLNTGTFVVLVIIHFIVIGIRNKKSA